MTPRTLAAPRAAPAILPLSELPGPHGLPLIGNLRELDPPRLHLQLEAWARRHGPLYRLRIGPRDALVLSAPDLVAEALRDRPAGWRRMRAMTDVLRELGGHGLMSAEGDEWQHQRPLVMHALDPMHLRRYFPSLARVTERLRRHLEARARDGAPIGLQPLLRRYTVDITASLAFGIDVNTIDAPDDPLRMHLDALFAALTRRMLSPVPWWRYVRLPSDRDAERHLAAVQDAVREFVASARHRMDRDPSLHSQPGTLLEALIAARDDDGIGLTEDEIVGNVLTVLLAGEDTTSGTLAWTLYLLHANRPQWRALVAVVDAALGDDPMPRSPERSHGLELVDDCVQEAARLRPAAPVIALEPNADTTIGGVALPRGTPVLCLMRPGAVDTSVAADARAFRPARWRQPAAGACPFTGRSAADAGAAPGGRDDRALLRATMPFGAGPRMCPGRGLAMLEARMLLATLARNFELLDVSAPHGGEPHEHLGFTMAPKGLTMRLAPRASA